MNDAPLPPAPSSPTPPPPSGGLTVQNWVTITHASQLLVFVTGCGHIVAPLIIWLLKKSESPEIDQAGRNVLNFQISYTIYAVVSGILMFAFIGIILLPIIGLMWLVLMIVGTIKASGGVNYVYPLSIKLL